MLIVVIVVIVVIIIVVSSSSDITAEIIRTCPHYFATSRARFERVWPEPSALDAANAPAARHELHTPAMNGRNTVVASPRGAHFAAEAHHTAPNLRIKTKNNKKKVKLRGGEAREARAQQRRPRLHNTRKSVFQLLQKRPAPAQSPRHKRATACRGDAGASRPGSRTHGFTLAPPKRLLWGRLQRVGVQPPPHRL